MFHEPVAQPPFRVMIFGACRETWYSSSDEERRDHALPALRQLIDIWVERGLNILESFDDDYFLVGQPGSLQFSFFILGEVPTLETLVSMMNEARTTRNGYRADRYFRFESRMGRSLFIIDDQDRNSQVERSTVPTEAQPSTPSGDRRDRF